MRMESLPTCNDLATKARIFVHLQHIYAEVTETNAGCDPQRMLPTGSRLIRKPGDQVRPNVS